MALIQIALTAALSAPMAAAFTRAPDVPLTDLKGARTTIDYSKKRVTMVNFWAVWCLPCREEMPQIAKLVDKYGKRGFQAVGIAVDSGEPADVQRWLDKNKSLGINYRIVLGGDDAIDRFGDVQIVPTTYLFDSEGKVVESFMGVHAKFSADVEAVLRKHLPAEPEPAKPSAPPPGRRAPSTPQTRPGA